MDAFLSRLSYHATSYAVRSCIALTSTFILKHGAKLLKSVDHHPLRAELGRLQVRLARKIELVAPILESIELRYTRGDSALETVVRTARGLQDEIEALGERLKNATSARAHSSPKDAARSSKFATAAQQQEELIAIVQDIKDLLDSIDDAIPLINLWVSAIGGIQAPPSSFSPSRLLQASMLVNVGDTQFVLNPTQPMQIGPDFSLSLYMLFRGHASSRDEQEPYGMEEGQRKPVWQEVVHKARVRLLRMPLDSLTNETASSNARPHYAYQLQLVEDLNDGRVHTLEDRDSEPTPYDGIPLAGIREFIPIHQISKLFYADVGKILNINNDDGASSSPVLLLKRDMSSMSVDALAAMPVAEKPILAIEPKGGSDELEASSSRRHPQREVDRQLFQEMGLVNEPSRSTKTNHSSQTRSEPRGWKIPKDLDPEWIALEVFDIEENVANSDLDSDSDSTGFEKQAIPGRRDDPRSDHSCRPRHTTPSSVDSNLITQMNRMDVASASRSSTGERGMRHSALTRSRPSSQYSSRESTPSRSLNPSSRNLASSKLIERSPFGAIKTSLSLLEMLLRLTSLQEFEQTTHLAIPDHMLKFYLDESVSTSGLHGKERQAASAEAERKVGFDPYRDRAS